MSKKLTKAALKKACSRHNWALQWCWNYEKMQAAGYEVSGLCNGFCDECEIHDSECEYGASVTIDRERIQFKVRKQDEE